MHKEEEMISQSDLNVLLSQHQTTGTTTVSLSDDSVSVMMSERPFGIGVLSLGKTNVSAQKNVAKLNHHSVSTNVGTDQKLSYLIQCAFAV